MKEKKDSEEAKDALEDGKAPESFGDKGKQGKTGIAIAGDVSINTVTDTTQAFINDKGTIRAEEITLSADNETDLIAASGSAAITTVGEKLSLGIAGSFSKNELNGTTGAYMAGTNISEADDLSLSADRSGDIFSLTAGGAGAPQKEGIAIAGSVIQSVWTRCWMK